MSHDTRLSELSLEAMERIRGLANPYDQFVDLSDVLIDRNANAERSLNVYRGPAADLTEPQRVFATLTRMDTQIQNGGLQQFFGNSPGWAEHAEWALLSVGATELAQAFRRAVERLSGGIEPSETRGLSEAIDAWFQAGDDDEDFEWFDDLYFGEFDRSTDRWSGLVQPLYESTVMYVLSNLPSFVQRPPTEGA